jgi:hypothetical protein
MASKPYKPEREVTSEKIKLRIEELYNKEYKGRFRTAAGTWRRISKKRLPESRGWVRLFQGYAHGNVEGRVLCNAIAISSEDDQKLVSVYLCDDAETEFKRLGVNEVMFS